MAYWRRFFQFFQIFYFLIFSVATQLATVYVLYNHIILPSLYEAEGVPKGDDETDEYEYDDEETEPETLYYI